MIDLLSYITQMPSDSDSHERAHKFPFLVGDLFAIDNNGLLDMFFEEEREDSSDEEKKEAIESPEKLEEEKGMSSPEAEPDMKSAND